MKLTVKILMVAFFSVITVVAQAKCDKQTSSKYDSLIYFFNIANKTDVSRNDINRIIKFLPETYTEYLKLGEYIVNHKIPSREESEEYLNRSEIYDVIFKEISSENRDIVFEKVVGSMKNCEIDMRNVGLAKSLEKFLYTSEEFRERFFNFLDTKSEATVRSFFIFVLGRSTYMGVEAKNEGSVYDNLASTHPKLYAQLEYVRKKYPGNKP